MSSGSDPKQNEPSARPRPGREGWDRIGQLMSQMGDAGQVIARRNLQVWTEISSNLDKRDFGADDWARNNLLVLGGMLDNAQTMAGLWTAAPPPAAVGALPTVFLSVQVDPSKGGQDATAAPAEVRVAPGVANPPKTGKVALSGLDPKAADALCAAITVTQAADDPTRYDVVFSWPSDAKDVIAEGTYFGLIYLEPPRTESLLADLRVLVRTV